MSSANADAVETDEDHSDQADGDQPPIEDDEMADMDTLAEQIEAETAPETTAADDDQDEADTADDGGEPTETSAEGVALDTPDGDSWGDWYVGTLTGVSNAVIEEYGDDADPIDESMARQFGIDDAIDRLMAERGTPDMPPEQQVLLGTLAFAAAVAVWKTDLASHLIQEADF